MGENLTVFFTDGFEDGTFNAWTAQGVSNGTTAVVTTAPHHGTRNAEYHCTNVGYAYWYKEPLTGSAQVTAYLRAYLQFKTTLPANNNEYFSLMAAYNTGTEIAMVYIVNVAGDTKWALEYRSGAGTLNAISAVAPLVALNRYYCVELYCFIDNAAGKFAVYIDGVPIPDLYLTGLDNNGGGDVNAIVLGEISSNGATDHIIYADDVLVADAYNGPDCGWATGTVVNNAVIG